MKTKIQYPAHVFVYGSLMSQKSLWRTLPEKLPVERGMLIGYERIVSALTGSNYVYMNLRQNPRKHVMGNIISVNEAEMKELIKREQGGWLRHLYKFLRISSGYEMLDITTSVTRIGAHRVYTFIAPSHPYYREYRTTRSYLNTCLDGVPEQKRAQWLTDTLLPGEIVEDADAPLYGVVDTGITKTKIC